MTPMTRHHTNDTALRGRALLNDPWHNKGTAFTAEERIALDLDGFLPPKVETLTEQCARVDDKYRRLHDDLERHIFLRALHDTNVVLFHAYVEANLAQLLPILYTPTVGLACQEFSHIYRRPHGLFLSYPDRDRIAERIAAIDHDVDVVVVTDGERILGLGDLGVGGMGIPIGKLSLYTAAGGINPRRTLPVFLDVGTNNTALLEDPLYLGWRHERITGDTYVDFVDTFVDALTSRFPGVLLQWEDFAGHHAADLLHRHRDRVLSFNDDIQGTAAVTLAAVHAAVIAADTALADQRVCIVGAGSAGTGIAAMLVDAIAADGATDPGSHLYLVDADGLLHDHRHDLTVHQQPFAQRWDHVADWANPTGPTPLAAVVDHVLPTVLIGVSGQPGLFTEPIIRSMAATTPHPIVLPLSNPTDRAEALPGDLLAWTDGRALIATGSPFGPVTRNGATHTIAQANNVYIFPGLGLGALAAGAHRITDSMLRAAARAVADTSPCTTAGPSAPILPALDDLHTVSRRIANAVANAAIDDDVSQDINRDDIDSRIAQHWWTPDYQTAAPTVQTRPSPSQ